MNNKINKSKREEIIETILNEGWEMKRVGKSIVFTKEAPTVHISSTPKSENWFYDYYKEKLNG